jgi:hypothetical protein
MTDDIDIQIIPSALKHPGVTEADIHNAFRTKRYDEPFEGDEHKELLPRFGAGD